jgi:predicted permease
MDLGFADPERLLLVATDLNVAGLKEAEGLVTLDRLLERAQALPGVTSASFSSMVPLGFGGHSFSGTRIEGYTPAADEQVSIERVIIGPDYFKTMGIPLVAGRETGPQDQQASLRVVVVNEAFVRRYWPGQDAVGKRLDQGQGWATVIGVAKDSAYRDLGETPYPVVYSALRQRYSPAVTLHVRAAGDPRALTEALRSTFTGINANLPFLDPRTLAEHVSASTFVQFIGASMLTAFGVLALLLSAVGLYGVLSYIVSQRKREIAIRMAIGASPKSVVNLVLRQGMALALTGLVIGGGAAFAAGQLLRSQLLGVSPGDPITFISVALLLSTVALFACLLPAWRASRTDPAESLKAE